MVSVLIKTDSHFTVNRKRIRVCVEKILQEKRVKGAVEVSVSIVGDRQMRQLNRRYRHLDKTTDVLSFCLTEGEISPQFVDPPDGIMRLGDIIISYPQVQEEAADEDMLIDDKVEELVIHGLNHLLGQHHEE
jgi:probable rRNA maturation factor